MVLNHEYYTKSTPVPKKITASERKATLGVETESLRGAKGDTGVDGAGLRADVGPFPRTVGGRSPLCGAKATLG